MEPMTDPTAEPIEKPTRWWKNPEGMYVGVDSPPSGEWERTDPPDFLTDPLAGGLMEPPPVDEDLVKQRAEAVAKFQKLGISTEDLRLAMRAPSATKRNNGKGKGE